MNEFQWIKDTSTIEEEEELGKLVKNIEITHRTYKENGKTINYRVYKNGYIQSYVYEDKIRTWVNNEREHSTGNIIANFVYEYMKKGYDNHMIVNLWTRYLEHLYNM
jgi:methionyl-tRNA synthetase